MRNGKDTIIFPLDVPTLKEAREYIDTLADSVGMFKVGLELFVRCGPEIIRHIHAKGSVKIFLDLKLHDIPATVSRAMAQIASLDVALATVHCGESPKMLEAAVAGSGGKVAVLGVTVLTSVSGDDLAQGGFEAIYCRDLPKLVLKRALMAHQAGCRGIVCSAQEAAAIKKRLGPDFLAVTPGIRTMTATIAGDDQQRVMTPGRAVLQGADYLVIGRPIRDAADPRGAARQIAREVDAVLSGQ